MVVRRPTEGPGHKDEPDLPPNLFVIGLLHDLKEGGYSRRAWAAFWRASWIRSVQIFQLNDELRASWLRFSIVGVMGISRMRGSVMVRGVSRGSDRARRRRRSSSER